MRPKMRPEMAKMRLKMSKRRPKMANMRLKMAMTKPKMAQMRLQKFGLAKMRPKKAGPFLRDAGPPLPPTSLIPCLEDATFDAVLLFFGSCFELGDLSSEGRVLGAPVVPCNVDF